MGLHDVSLSFFQFIRFFFDIPDWSEAVGSTLDLPQYLPHSTLDRFTSKLPGWDFSLWRGMAQQSSCLCRLERRFFLCWETLKETLPPSWRSKFGHHSQICRYVHFSPPGQRRCRRFDKAMKKQCPTCKRCCSCGSPIFCHLPSKCKFHHCPGAKRPIFTRFALSAGTWAVFHITADGSRWEQSTIADESRYPFSCACCLSAPSRYRSTTERMLALFVSQLLALIDTCTQDSTSNEQDKHP